MLGTFIYQYLGISNTQILLGNNIYPMFIVRIRWDYRCKCAWLWPVNPYVKTPGCLTLGRSLLLYELYFLKICWAAGVGKNWNCWDPKERKDFPGGSVVKNTPVMQETQETWVWFLGQEDPLEKGMATYSSTLAWRILWIEEPGGLQSTETQRVRHDWNDLAYTIYCPGNHTWSYLFHVHMLWEKLRDKIDFLHLKGRRLP